MSDETPRSEPRQADAAPPPAPPPPPAAETDAGVGRRDASVRIPRWAVVTTAIFLGLLIAAALFGAGWIARGSPSSSDGGGGAVTTSCSTKDILQIAKEWTAAQRRFYRATEGTAEEKAALDAASNEDDRMEATFMKCFPE